LLHLQCFENIWLKNACGLILAEFYFLVASKWLGKALVDSSQLILELKKYSLIQWKRMSCINQALALFILNQLHFSGMNFKITDH